MKKRYIRTVSSYKETVCRNGTYVLFLCMKKQYVHTLSLYEETVRTYHFLCGDGEKGLVTYVVSTKWCQLSREIIDHCVNNRGLSHTEDLSDLLTDETLKEAIA